jgi:hypothetical protein
VAGARKTYSLFLPLRRGNDGDDVDFGHFASLILYIIDTPESLCLRNRDDSTAAF